MNPLIKIALWGLAAIGVGKLFQNNADTNDGSISGILKDGVDESYREFHNANTDVSNLKRMITSRINAIIANCKVFKIGETGSPHSRRKGYEGYNKMYLLCTSRSESFIDELENNYNHRYFEHPKNKNLKRGSAGKMGSPDGFFHLYVVTD